MFRKLVGTLSIFVICSVVGCGNEFGKPVTVIGKITIGGMPVGRARIIFTSNDKKLPAELRTMTTELKPDGSYTLGKVYLSEYTVMLESMEAMDATKSAEPAPSPLTPYGPTSTLRAQVTPDKTTFDFDLPGSK